MSEPALESAAAYFPDPFRLIVRDELSSTNDEAKRMAEIGAASGTVVLAKTQTAGRGRRGAAWFSSSQDSLAFSILLRPSEPKHLWPRLALASGLAVAEAIESFGISAGIKWPNDVWINQRKVAGILVEAGADYAIIGIGLNVNTHEFPTEIAEIATSLHAQTHIDYSRADVLAAIIRRFAIRCQHIQNDFDLLLEAVRERCVLTKHTVSLLVSGQQRIGIIHGISATGELLFEENQHITPLIQADEIRIIR